MSDELITIEINDKKVEVRPGQMLIEVADNENVHIPRFCYHEKLTVAANCRMCLVEVEKSHKPLPACATPVADGMKVWTNSEVATSAQKDTMEFLLINHPLDCPICDQGGECELQDLSVAHGASSSNFSEIKRVVRDKDIGELVSTEMTRCIQCTRCVRFGEEISGMRELGAVGRGERMEIDTFVEKSLVSELSGNIIDICPVGALTAKPSRYSARAWEVAQTSSIAPHDSLGSNINLHSFKNKVVRAVARENEAVNECWISDRDRFAYQGIYSDDRVQTPLLKEEDYWKPISWEEALQLASEKIDSVDASDVGVLMSQTSSLEEMYLLQKLMRSKGVTSIDSRLRQIDFRQQENMPTIPWLGVSIEEVEQQKAIFVLGSSVRQHTPMLNHRIRKAVINNDAAVSSLNIREFNANYPLSVQGVSSYEGLLADIAAIASASGDLPQELSKLASKLKRSQLPNDAVKQIVVDLHKADDALVLVGENVENHPEFSTISAFVQTIATNTGAKIGFIPSLSNTIGAYLAGAVPHLSEGAKAIAKTGENTQEILSSNKKVYLTMNIDAANDFRNPELVKKAYADAEFVIAISPFADESLKASANLILPGSTFAESSGTYVNAEGRLQNVRAASKLQGEARPTWKILRVLGNALAVEGFDYVSSKDVLKELQKNIDFNVAEDVMELPLNALVTDVAYKQSDFFADKKSGQSGEMQRLGEVAQFAIDQVVRRATALNASDESQEMIQLNMGELQRRSFVDGQVVVIEQNGKRLELPVKENSSIPDNSVLLLSGTKSSAQLGDSFGSVTLYAVNK